MRLVTLLSTLCLLLLSTLVFGQGASDLANAEAWLKKAPKDSLYVDKLNYLSNKYALSGAEDPLALANMALRLSDSLSYMRGKGIAHMNLAIINDIRGSYHAALEHYLKGMRLLKKVKDEDYLSELMQNLGYFYHIQGNNKKAIEVTKQAAELAFKNHGVSGSTYLWSNLGLYYSAAGDYDSALFYTLQAYEVLKVDKDTAGLADVFYNLGSIAWKADKSPRKALNYALQAQKFYVAKPIEAEAYIECKSFIGEMYLQLGEYSMAEYYLNEALQEAQQNQFRYLIKNIYKVQADLYATTAAWEKAYQSHYKFFQLYDSIYNEQSINRVEQLKAEFEQETQEAKIELLNKSKMIQDDEMAQQLLLRNSFIGLFGLILIVAGVLYKSNTANKRANKLLLEQKRQIEVQHADILEKNLQLEDQKNALLSQAQNLHQANHQISRQRQAIEQTSQNITTSLSYASRIQHAMLAHPDELKNSTSRLIYLA